MTSIIRMLGILVMAVGLGGLSGAAEAQPVFSKVFTPDTIGPNSSASLTYTIDNSAGPATEPLSFANVLPAVPGAMTIADGSASHTCGAGTLSAPSGGTTVSFTGGEIGAAGTCTITVNVTAATLGVYTNGAVTLSSSEGSSASLAADLTVAADTPSFSKSFGPNPITVGETSTLTFLIDNSASASNIINLDFTDTLPSGVVVADPSNATTDCVSGLDATTLIASPGSGTIELNADGAFFAGFEVLSAGATCSVVVDVTSSSVGSHFNSVELLADFASAGLATDTLVVTGVGSDNLQIIKEFTDDPTPPGGTVALEFTIQNTSRSDAATGITFTDDLAAMLAGAALTGTMPTDPCGPGSSVNGGGLLTLSGGNLPAEGSCTFVVSVAVPGGAAGGTYVNTTSAVTGTINGNGVTGNQASATLTVQSAIPLVVAKAYSVDEAEAGDTVTLEITITNHNAVAATDIALVDDLGAAFAGANPTVAPFPAADRCGVGSFLFSNEVLDSRVLTLQGGSLGAAAPGAPTSCTFSVPVTVPSDLPGGDYRNITGAATATIDGATVTSAPAEDTLLINGGVNLSLSKAFTDDPVTAGSTGTLEFTIVNSAESAVDATDIAFTDDLNAMLAGVESTSGAQSDICGIGSSLSGTSELTFTGGTLAKGETCSFSVTFSVPLTATSDEYTNTTSALTAMAGGLQVSTTPAEAELTVAGVDGSRPEWSLEILGVPAMAGGTVTFRYVIDNLNLTTDLTGLSFTHALEDALTGLSTTTVTLFDACGPGSVALITNANQLDLIGGSLTAGDSCTISLEVVIPAGADDQQYTVRTSDLNSNQGVTPAVSGILEVQSDLIGLTKEFLSPTAISGADATVRFTLENLDAVNAMTGIAFSDDLNAFLGGAAATGLPFAACGGTVDAIPDAGTIDFTGGALAASGTCTFDVDITLPLTQAGIYTNTTSEASGTVDGLAVSGPSDTASLQIISPTPLTFEKAFADDTIVQGDTTRVIFTIDNTANTALDATGLAVIDPLPAGLVVAPVPNVESTCAAGTITAAAGASSISVANVTVTQRTSCTVSVSVRAMTPGIKVNTTGDLTSNFGNSGGATASLTVTAAPVPVFSKAFDPGTIRAAETADLVFTIDNTAALIEATAITFVDTLPAGVELVEPVVAVNRCGIGTMIANTATDTFSVNGVAAPAGTSCTFTAKVTSSVVGTHTNTSGDMTSSLGNSGPATDVLEVIPELPPVFSKSFAGDIVQGDVTSLVFTIDNTGNALGVTALDFTDTFPAGLTIATPSNASNGCGGALIAAAGTNTVSLADGVVGAGADCVISVDVTSVTTGPAVNTSGDLTSSNGNSGPASDTLTVNAAAPPDFAKAFAPDTVIRGEESLLTFTIDNSGRLIEATGLAFTDDLPAGMSVAATPAVTNDCNGTVTAEPGGGSISLAAGDLGQDSACTIGVRVVTAADGPLLNTSGDLTSSLGNSGTAVATLSVDPAPVPLFGKAFVADTVVTTEVSTLTFTIENTALVAASALGFVDTFPAGLVIAPVANAATDCNSATLTAVAGGDTVELLGGRLASGDSCTVSVDVASATPGTYTNVSGKLTSSLGDSGTASALLNVNDAPLGFSQMFAPASVAQAEVSELTFEIVNTAPVAASAVSFANTLPAGLVVSDAQPASTTCPDATLTAVAGSDTLTVTGGTLGSGLTCEVSVFVAAPMVDTYTNVSGALTSSLGDSGTSSAALTVTPAPVPDFTKSFPGGAVAQGGVTSLQLVIDNSAAFVAATDLAVTDSLPVGLEVAAVPNAASDCGGALTANAGAGVVTLSGGTVAAGASCTIQVDLRATVAGNLVNTTGNLVSSLGNSGLATATLTVSAAPVPGFAKSFDPANVQEGAPATLMFEISNATSLMEAGLLDFTDVLPAGLVVAANTNAATTCDGAVLTAVPGSDTIALTGGMLDAGASCTAQVDIQTAAAGAYVNTSGDLTSTLGNSGTAIATLTVGASGVPGFTKLFTPDAIEQGASTTLRFEIDNATALIDATDLDFTDDLPAGLVVASAPAIDNSCIGGTLTAAPGASVISYSGGSVAAASSCAIEVAVTATGNGALTNITGDLTSSFGNSGPSTDTLTVSAAPTPAFAKVFTPGTVALGGLSTLSFTIDNTGALVPATALAFGDDLPAGLTVASVPNATSTCNGGSLVAAAGDTAISLAGAAVDAGAICTVSVDVVAGLSGTLTNLSGDLTSDLGNSGPATDTLTVTAAALPGFAKAFAPDTIVLGETATLSFTVDNTTALVPAEDLAFADNFPAGMQVAATPNLVNGCGGTVTANPAGTTLSLAGGSVPARAFCTISVDVLSTADGSLSNISDELTSSLGNSGLASAVLTVTGAPAPAFAKVFTPDSIVQGDTSVLRFTIDNAAALVAADDLAFTDDFPAGLEVAAVPALSNTCGGSVSAVPGAESVVLAGGSLAAGATCEIDVTVRGLVSGTLVNSSGALTSSSGNSGTASDTLTVSAAPLPVLSLTLSEETPAEGQTTELTITIDNSAALIDLSGLGFDIGFSGGVAIADPSGIVSDCIGGTLSAPVGGDTVTLDDATVPAGAICTVTVTLVATDIGAGFQISAVLSTAAGSAGAVTKPITVVAATTPAFAQGFAPAQIVQGDTSTLTFTIDNTANFVDADALGFDNTLPGPVTVAALPGIADGCGGTLATAAGAGSLSYSGGSVAAGTSCTVSVNVTSATVGAHTNTSGALTSTLGDSGPSTAVLSVIAAPAPGFAKAFDPDTILQDGVTTLRFTIDNTGALVPATDLAFADGFAADITVAAAPNAVSSCGGTLSAAPGASDISFSGGSVAAGALCEIALDVTSSQIGGHVDAAGPLSSSLGNSGNATATLTVEVQPNGTVTIVQQSDEDGSFGFASTEPGLTFTIVTTGGSGRAGPVSVAAGTYLVTQSRPEGIGNTSVTCDDGDSFGDATSGALTINLAARESVTCTFSSIQTVQKTVDTINRFLTKRADLILSSEPSANRRFDRLNRGFGNASLLSFSDGDLKSFLPFTAKLGSSGRDFAFTSSLLQMRQAAASLQLAHGGPARGMYVDNTRFDAWFEAQYKEFDGVDSRGHFAIAYFGVDYLVTPDVLVGALVQFDDMEDSASSLGSSARGKGWMFGPYLTARVAPNLYFDGRVAAGRSSNEVSPFDTYTDDFSTDRWMAQASLTGEMKRGAWTIRPSVDVSYYSETQEGYTDALGVDIPSQTIELGQIKMGPAFTGNFETSDGLSYAPHLAIDAIYNFGGTSGVDLSNPDSIHTEGLRGRLQAGVSVRTKQGARLAFSGTYDGIGVSDYDAWGVSVEVEVPLQ